MEKKVDVHAVNDDFGDTNSSDSPRCIYYYYKSCTSIISPQFEIDVEIVYQILNGDYIRVEYYIDNFLEYSKRQEFRDICGFYRIFDWSANSFQPRVLFLNRAKSTKL